MLSKEKMVLMYTIISAFALYFGSFLLIFSMWEANLRMIAATLYLAFATVVSYTRYMTRTGLGIQQGDAMTDVCLSVLFYPLVLAQCGKCAPARSAARPRRRPRCRARARARARRGRRRASERPSAGSARLPRGARARASTPCPCGPWRSKLTQRP